MDLDESEAEIRELVERLDRLIPRDGAHLTIPAEPEGNTTLGNRLGYLRFGLEFLAAALHPLPASHEQPTRVEPRLDYLLTPDSRPPFDLCEVDEAIVSRPPVRAGVGALGQLMAAAVVVALLILAFMGGSVVVRWLFG